MQFYEPWLVRKNLGRNFVPARLNMLAGDRSVEQLAADMLLDASIAMERIATQEVRIRVVFSADNRISREKLEALLRQFGPAKSLSLTSVTQDSLYIFAKI